MSSNTLRADSSTIIEIVDVDEFVPSSSSSSERSANPEELTATAAAVANTTTSTTTTPKRAASLALPIGLFANQSRPVTTTTTTTTTSRSEPFATSLDSSATSAFGGERRASLPTTPKSKKSFKGLPPRFRKLRRSSASQKKKSNKMANSIMKHGGPPENALQWLEASCPNDVVPKVLAFCGPQLIATLMATNRYWFQLIAQNDATWRTLCEGMYKWREGEDEPPTTSWKDYYRLHPCVPIDYPSIPRALAVATDIKTTNTSRYNMRSNSSNNANKKEQQVRSVEILLRPGKHFVKESLVVCANPDVTVALKTMTMPPHRHYSPKFAYAEQEHPQSFPMPSKSKSRNSTLKQWMGCKSTTAAVEGGAATSPRDLDANFYDSDSSETPSVTPRARSLSTGDAQRIHHLMAVSTLLPPPQYPSRATLVLRTRRINEPVVRVKQGQFCLKSVDLEHASQGVDIWNGNAAVQIQPPLGPDNEPLDVQPRPSARLDNVAISSKSGRGVVCLDGGLVELEDCMIYDCAATGLYVGGPGSQADISTTDVIRNGIGSRLPPSRMPRVTSGHSGVYLEQGLARINECNISSNYLTGISAVSFERAFLHLSKSDLVANGQGNLEVPPPGTLSHDKSEIAKDNNLASVGRPCLRSNLELPARARARASF